MSSRIIVVAVLVLLSLLSGCSSKLQSAAYHGDLISVRSLLENGSDPNQMVAGLYAPLSTAASQGHKDIVLELIKYGADVNEAAFFERPADDTTLKIGWVIRGQNRRLSYGTPIMVAAALGDQELFDIFLNNGADIFLMVDENRHDLMEGASVLHFAAAGGNTAIVKFLLDSGLNIESRISDSGEGLTLATPLYVTAQTSNVEVMKLLLDAGADPNARAEYETTPLLNAVIQNSPESLQLLIEYSADINATNVSGRTALSWAAFKGYFGIAEILIANDASLTADSEKYLQAYTHHLAADGLQKSNPEKAVSLYSKALHLYEESIPVLERKASNEKILDVALRVAVNAASASISQQRAQLQANTIAAATGEPATVYYTIPQLTVLKESSSYDDHITRCKQGANRIREVLRCNRTSNLDLSECAVTALEN